jgi:hypothetical protein
MPKILNLLFFIVGIIATVVGLLGLKGNPMLLAAIPVGLGLMYFAYRGDAARERNVADTRRTSIDKRIAELTKSPWASHQTIRVSGSIWMAIVMLLVAICSALAVLAGVSRPSIHWPMLLSGLFFLAISVIALPRALASLFRPALELTKYGFVTPIHGSISWRDVSGVCLQTIENRGTTSYVLSFRVEHYRQIVKDIHWTESLLYFIGLGAARRGIVTLPLRDGDEKPETIEAAARFLWTQATGQQHYWNPMLPKSMNDAGKRVNEFVARHKDDNAIEQALKANPEKALAEIEQFANDMTTIRTGQKRWLTQLNYVTYITLGAMALVLLWPLFKWLAK